jgi:hypothetical protein
VRAFLALLVLLTSLVLPTASTASPLLTASPTLSTASPTGADGVVVATGAAFAPGHRPPLPDTPVVITRGSRLLLINAEYPGEQPTHNLWHDAEVPQFSSDEVSTGQTTEVIGVASLAPGRYPFVCTIHRQNMTGVLEVV